MDKRKRELRYCPECYDARRFSVSFLKSSNSFYCTRCETTSRISKWLEKLENPYSLEGYIVTHTSSSLLVLEDKDGNEYQLNPLSNKVFFRFG